MEVLQELMQIQLHGALIHWFLLLQGPQVTNSSGEESSSPAGTQTCSVTNKNQRTDPKAPDSSEEPMAGRYLLCYSVWNPSPDMALTCDLGKQSPDMTLNV